MLERESGEGIEGSGGCRLSGGGGVFGAPFFVAGTPGRGRRPPKTTQVGLPHANPLPEERLQDCRRVWPELRVSVEPSPRPSGTHP